MSEERPLPRVLIVEPEETLAEEMDELVQSTGYLSKVASNHFQGLTRLEDENFDFVLVSMDNTGIDGLEFCKICRQRADNGRISCPYIILIGEKWHLVTICENDVPANDFLIRPYLSCELRWRLLSGLSVLNMQDQLRRMLDTEPETGLKNQRGIKSALHEEINRQGRKRALLGIAILNLEQFEFLELTNGKFWAKWARQTILRYLGEVLRNYDHLGELLSGNLCILSAENSFEGMEALIQRMEKKVKEMQTNNPYFPQEIIEVKFRGVFLSLRMETKPGNIKDAWDKLWAWIEKQDMQLSSGLSGYRGKYSESGLEIAES